MLKNKLIFKNIFTKSQTVFNSSEQQIAEERHKQYEEVHMQPGTLWRR